MGFAGGVRGLVVWGGRAVDRSGGRSTMLAVLDQDCCVMCDLGLRECVLCSNVKRAAASVGTCDTKLVVKDYFTGNSCSTPPVMKCEGQKYICWAVKKVQQWFTGCSPIPVWLREKSL